MTQAGNSESLRNAYMWLVTATGAATVAICAYSLPVAQIDRRLVILVLAMLIGVTTRPERIMVAARS